MENTATSQHLNSTVKLAAALEGAIADIQMLILVEMSNRLIEVKNGRV